MQTLQANTVPDLISQLLLRYKILPSQPTTSLSQAHTLLTSKTKQCRLLQQKLQELEYQNAELKLQNEISLNNAKSSDCGAAGELAELRKKVEIFESAFREEEDYVGELKEMLSGKEEKVKQIIEDYEREIEELKGERRGEGKKGDEGLRKEVEEMRGELEVQERMIASLMGNNTKLKEENKGLRKRIQEMAD